MILCDFLFHITWSLLVSGFGSTENKYHRRSIYNNKKQYTKDVVQSQSYSTAHATCTIFINGLECLSEHLSPAKLRELLTRALCFAGDTVKLGNFTNCFMINSNMTWFFSPIKATDTNWALFSDKSHFPIQPVVTVFFFFGDAPFRESVLLSVFWGWSWVNIRIEIKTLYGSVINLIGRWHSANYWTIMLSFSFSFFKYSPHTHPISLSAIVWNIIQIRDYSSQNVLLGQTLWLHICVNMWPWPWRYGLGLRLGYTFGTTV